MSGDVAAAAARRSFVGFLLWAAGEVLVVVAGVLIAFGLNAWWVERSARIEEQTHLRALVRDFEDNVALYEELIQRARRSADASRDLLELARNQPASDPDVVRPLVGYVFSSYRKPPAFDAYEALVSSAGLTLIRDEKLRAALAGFADRAREPYQQRFADQVYLAFVTRYIGQLQLGGPVPGAAGSYTELLRDPVFLENLGLRQVLEGDVAGEYELRLREARAILEQLRAQIDGRQAAETLQ
jgi:hypothetical protein